MSRALLRDGRRHGTRSLVAKIISTLFIVFVLVPINLFCQTVDRLPDLPVILPKLDVKEIDLLFPQRPGQENTSKPMPLQWRGESVIDKGSTLFLTKGTIEREDIGSSNVVLKADSIEYNRIDQSMKATGSVVLESAEFRMSCHRLEIKMIMSNQALIPSGEAWGVTFELPPSWILVSQHLSFISYEGDTMGLLGKLLGGGKADRTVEFHFEEVSVSPCPDETHSWFAKASSLDLKTGSYIGHSGFQGYAKLKNIVLKLGHVPIMWMPWALFPARVDRAPGLLPPEIGYNSRLGLALGMSYFQPFGSSADATLSPTWYSKEGMMWGLESRWAPEFAHKGNLQVKYIRPKTTSESRYRVNLHEIWDLDNGWFARADVNHASDHLMEAEFGRIASNPLGTPIYDSSVFIGKNFKWATFSIFASDQRTFFQPDDPFYNNNFPASLQKIKLPEGQLRLYPIPIGNFHLDGSSRVGRLGYYLDLGDDEPLAKYQWERSDHHLRISGRLGQIGPLRADMQIGGRFTHYSAVLTDTYFDLETPSDENRLPPNPIDNPVFDPFRIEGPSTQRWIGSSRLQFSAPQLGRSFLNLKFASYSGDIKHILEPMVAVAFNSKNKLAGLFPRFDEADTRPGVGNTAVGERSIEFGLKQHLFGRPNPDTSYADLVRARTSIKYYFDPIIYSDGRIKQGWSSFDTDVDIEPNRTLRLSFRQATEMSEGTADSSVSADVAITPSTRFRLAFFNSGINRLHIKQRGIKTGGSYGTKDDRFGLQFEVNYDFERKTFTQSRVEITYGSPCVAYSIRYYHIYLPEISPFRREDRVDFALSLRNLGELFSAEIGRLFGAK